MNPKKLTQAVFDGLPSEYRWAAVDRSIACQGGRTFAFKSKPIISEKYCEWIDPARLPRLLVEGSYEARNWRESLIERQDVPTVADIDWSRQDVPEGATHYAIQDGGVTWLKDDYSFWSVWDDGEWAACGIPVAQPIPTTPEPQVDWSKAPEGATHYNTSSGAFFKRLDSGLVRVSSETAGEWASLGAYTVFDLESSTCTIKRPESIHDVARSIEAARIEERACMPWPDGDMRYFETSPVGQKHDTSKPRHSLLPVGSVERVIDVLEFGATKYAPDNWQHVSDARTRYYDAAMRHLSAWWRGETHDAESGLHHLAHAACCILFLLWFERGAK